MIRLESVSKIYPTPRGAVKALDGVEMAVEQGEFVVIRGPSGSGKTTLLLTLGGMLKPTTGRVEVEGTDLYARTAGDRARFRAEKVGFVFQAYHLVPYLSTVENVLLARGSDGGPDKRKDAEALLDRLNLSHRIDHRPGALSSGERQRAAFARALLNRPVLMLADEPTGNLDPDNAREAMEHLAAFHEEGGTVLVVTHGEAANPFADRVLTMKEGKLI